MLDTRGPEDRDVENIACIKVLLSKLWCSPLIFRQQLDTLTSRLPALRFRPSHCGETLFKPHLKSDDAVFNVIGIQSIKLPYHMHWRSEHRDNVKPRSLTIQIASVCESNWLKRPKKRQNEWQFRPEQDSSGLHADLDIVIFVLDGFYRIFQELRMMRVITWHP